MANKGHALSNTNGTDDYLTVDQIAATIGLVTRKLHGYIYSGLLDGIYIDNQSRKGSIDAKYLFRKSDLEIVRQKINANERARELFLKNPSMVTDFQWANILTQSLDIVLQQISNGKWQDAIVGYYFTAHQQRKVWVLDRNLVREQQAFKNLSVIAREVGISDPRLRRFVYSGMIKLEQLEGTELYKYTKDNLLQQYREAVSLGHKNRRYGGVGCFDLLDEENRRFITEYLDFRKAFRLTGPGQTYPTIYNTDTHKQHLGVITLVLAARRSNAESAPKLRNLHAIPEGIRTETFSFADLKEEDVLFLKENTGWAKRTYEERLTYLKPMLCYVIRMMRKSGNYDTVSRLSDLIEIFPPTNSGSSGEFDESKAFLTRRELLQVYYALRSDPTAHKFCALRNATMWMIGTFMGLRPEELIKVRIHDFAVDSNGYLAIDKDGWGMFHLPAERSKMRKTPSHRLFGTPIVPQLVSLLTEYLAQVYQHQSPGTDGWLFRPETQMHDPEVRLKSPGKWMSALRPSMDFLAPSVRPRLELKTSRRSMNELIDGTVLTGSNSQLSGYQKQAAQIHMRHRRSGTVGDRHYRKPISEIQFRRILNATLNFPWDLGQLDAWEQAASSTRRDIQDDSNLDYVEHSLGGALAQLSKLDKQPKNMTVAEWLEAKKRLKDEIAKIRKTE